MKRLSAPSFTALTDEQLCEFLRIDPSTDKLTRDLLLSSAVDLIEGMTNTILIAADYQMWIGEGVKRFPLPANVNTLEALAYRDSDILDPLVEFYDSTEETPADYYHDQSCGWLEIWRDGLGPICLSMNVGYTSPEEMPADIRHALIVLVSGGYDDRTGIPDSAIKAAERLCARHRRIAI